MRSRPPSAASLLAIVVPLVAFVTIAGCARRTNRPLPPGSSGQWMGAGSSGGSVGPGGLPPAATGGGAPPPAGEPQRILDAHNRRRAEHCAPPLAWSPEVAAAAQRWADALGSRGCALEHSSGQLGENLASGSAAIMGPERAVDMWLEERARYDFGRGGFSMATGHFTQLVWRSSRLLGCGVASCGAVRVWVCNYDPPGNVEGQFGSNVGTCAR
jgi:hypothetical protein